MDAEAEAMTLQRPLPGDMLRMVARGAKEDASAALSAEMASAQSW